jgi:hypothetical protein
MQYELQMLENLLLEARTTFTELDPPFKDLLNLDIAHITITSFY